MIRLSFTNTEVIQCDWMIDVIRHSPLIKSQIRIVLSYELLIIRLSLTNSDAIPAVWPSNIFRQFPVLISQIRIVLSHEPLNNNRLSLTNTDSI